jgi:cyclopropane fatty-acyl-phospholipid synthase-like methyltransferase
MEATIYTDGTYLRNNPDWHADDSAWKAGHVAAMLAKHGIAPRSVCEVGCGSGEILVELAKRLPAGTRYAGYDISPDAYALCSRKAGGAFEFHLADLLETDATFDVALAMDVFEHVEDYFGFLRKLRPRARNKIFHIPLEMSALAVARPDPLIKAWRPVGHLHPFTRDTALAALERTGYRVIDSQYTSGRTELGNLGWKTRLLKVPRRIAHALDQHAAARILGGYSLLVLAE